MGVDTTASRPIRSSGRPSLGRSLGHESSRALLGALGFSAKGTVDSDFAQRVLEEGELGRLDLAAFIAEWKWDGIRVQAAAGTREDGQRVTRLYTRTGEGWIDEIVEGDAVLKLSSLGVEVSLDVIYEDTELDATRPPEDERQIPA